MDRVYKINNFEDFHAFETRSEALEEAWKMRLCLDYGLSVDDAEFLISNSEILRIAQEKARHLVVQYDLVEVSDAD